MARAIAFDANAIAPGSLVVSAEVGITLAMGGFVIGIGAAGLAAGTTSFWYLSRATGFVAYLLLWGSVTWGLLLSTGTGRAWMRPAQLLDAHQFLSALGVGFACFHGLVLMGDRYVSFSLRAVILPFGGSYEPLLVALGQIALWLSLLLIASFHVRRQIGGRVWRRLHYASFVAFWLAVYATGGFPCCSRNAVSGRWFTGSDWVEAPSSDWPRRCSTSMPHARPIT